MTMRIGIVLCATIGHRWHVDETSTEADPVLRCARCGRHQLPNIGTAFDRRMASKSGSDRAVGPFGGRR